MKKRILIVFLFLNFLISCVPNSNTTVKTSMPITVQSNTNLAEPTQTNTQIILTATQTKTKLPPTKTPTPTPFPPILRRTWEPKIPLDEEKLLSISNAYISQELDCKIPCWLGVTVGVSNFNAAVTFLKQRFATQMMIINESDGFDGISIVVPTDSTNGIYISATLYIFKENKNIQTTVYLPKVKKYQLFNILNDYGKPDRILLNGWLVVDDGTNEFNLLLVYDDEGIFFDFNGKGKDMETMIHYCPQSFYANHLILWDPDSDYLFKDVINNNNGFYYDDKYERKLESVTSDTIALFTEKMTDLNHLGCISISKEKWDLNN